MEVESYDGIFCALLLLLIIQAWLHLWNMGGDDRRDI